MPFAIEPILGNAVLRAPACGNVERQELIEQLGDADALICLLSVQVDVALLAAAPKLRIVANFAVGYDNIDVAAATRRGIAISNTPDVLTDATADFAFALLMACARRVVEGDQLVRSGRWNGWAPDQLLGCDIAGRTIGIVGMGRIGMAMARRARGFAMQVLFCGGGKRLPETDVFAGMGADAGIRRVPLSELLTQADFVSLHCPLNDETHHLLNQERLGLMKPSAIVINTARGSCIDEAALARAVDDGTIAGAGLDVFSSEPAVHPALLQNPRIVLAPHVGSATTTARRRMAEICAHAVRDILDGQKPQTLVNPEVFS